jgi:hypothetical protein
MMTKELGKLQKTTKSNLTGMSVYTYALMDDGSVLFKLGWNGYSGVFSVSKDFKVKVAKGKKATIENFDNISKTLKARGYVEVDEKDNFVIKPMNLKPIVVIDNSNWNL